MKKFLTVCIVTTLVVLAAMAGLDHLDAKEKARRSRENAVRIPLWDVTPVQPKRTVDPLEELISTALERDPRALAEALVDAEKQRVQQAAPRVVLMEVTAYCPCKKCCGPKAQGITASGRPVQYNGGKFVAADKKYAFGTKLRVPGYAGGEVVTVQDRGGAIKGEKLDVYFSTHEAALAWGRKKDVPVEFVE